MSKKERINMNGSISGIVNFGSNSININIKEKNNIPQVEDQDIKKSEKNNRDFTKLKKNKFSSNMAKKMIDIVIGVIISVIAGCILYLLNIN